MKKLTTVLFLGILVLMVGCSKKKSTTPEEVGDYTLQASETIGSEGGDLTVDDFSLTVPPGSFASDVELKLYASSEDRPFGDNGVSRTFRLEGFPDEYSQPLEVRIKYEGTLSEESFITIGEEVFISSTDSVKTTYDLFAATDSSDYLICALPVPEESPTLGKNLNTSAKVSSGGGFLSFLGITSYSRYTSGGGHFQIRYPAGSVLPSDMTALGQYLEEAYTKFQNMGFSYGDRTSWPVEVVVKDLGPEAYGYHCPSILGDNHAYLKFNKDKLSELSEIRVTAGHEFFHLVQYLYDSRNRYSKAKFEPTHQWLNEACAVWSEEKFSDQSNYVSPVRAGHEMAPFNGMQAGAQTEASYHGYGMSVFIKYLVKEYGEGILVSIYQNIGKGYHPVQAINASIGHQLVLRWESFLREYVLGNIYNVDPSIFTSNRSGLFRIQSDSDTLETFTASYPDLSAKLFMIRLDYPDIDESAVIDFKVDKSLSNITVFKFKFGSPTEYLAYSATGSVTIPDVKALTDEDWHLFVMVTNLDFTEPYTNSKDISLEVKVTPKRQFTHCYIYLHIYGYWKRESPGYLDSSEGNTDFMIWNPSIMESHDFSENTFTATWEDWEYADRLRSGNITVTLNGSGDAVIYFCATQEEKYQDYDRVDSVSISGTNIPVIEHPSENCWIYGVEGVETCNYISSVEHSVRYLSEKTLINYDCNAESYVEIELY